MASTAPTGSVALNKHQISSKDSAYSVKSSNLSYKNQCCETAVKPLFTSSCNPAIKI